jgi:hypothetical protein
MWNSQKGRPKSLTYILYPPFSTVDFPQLARPLNHIYSSAPSPLPPSNFQIFSTVSLSLSLSLSLCICRSFFASEKSNLNFVDRICKLHANTQSLSIFVSIYHTNSFLNLNFVICFRVF